MEWRAEGLLEELRNLIRQLGRDGGQISPAVYDTAQVLRLYPPREGVEPGLRWILAQQAPDGGWGNPYMPRTRDVPTLAAVLALHHYRQVVPAKAAVEAGLEFLATQAGQWTPPLTDDIPVAVELILPHLVHEAHAAGLAITIEPYRALVELGNRKRHFLARLPAHAGTPFAFSFEAWGVEPAKAMLDRLGSVGNSPSATAAWLRLANGRPDLADEIRQAERYLIRANLVTDARIPGLSPTAWPINRFEQAFALHALHLSGALTLPALFPDMARQVTDLKAALGPAGVGFNDNFAPDGDDTAAAVAVISALGIEQDPAVLMQFRHGSYFCAYNSELQPSLSVTARAVSALTSTSTDVRNWQEFLAHAQTPDGIWPGDKWNVSWLYTTCLVLHALAGPDFRGTKSRALDALLRCQQYDGGWGMGDRSTALETALGLLALHQLHDDGAVGSGIEHGLARGLAWLLSKRQSRRSVADELWLNKQLYCPARIDQGYILGALLRGLQDATRRDAARNGTHATHTTGGALREAVAVI